MMTQIKAVIWILTGMFFGACNDVWVKYLNHIPAFQISCCRFFFSMISLLPLVLIKREYLKVKYPKVHFLRGIVFFSAITLWEIGVKNTMLSVATLVGFSGTFFLLMMSKFILGEKIGIPRLLSTGISFIMILGIVDFKNLSLGSSIIILLFGSFFFAVADVINKKYSLLENHITSIFYYNIFAFSISIPLALKSFVMPSFIDLIYMICLGFEANLYSFSLLRAFSLADATFLTPFKYFEFVFSIFLGYVFFNEIPTIYCFVVIFVIVINNSTLLYIEKKNTNIK